MKTHMNLELPATDCLVCQDLCEGDGQTISEKPLTCLTLHIQSCKERHPSYNTITIKQNALQSQMKEHDGGTKPVDMRLIFNYFNTFLRLYMRTL